ncbi:MAG: tyrosine-type recombinase/integrase [Candidatus Nanopelagicales bacterium]
MAADPAGTAPPVPLDTAIAGFLTMLRAGKPSPHTITAYAADVNLVRERLDARPEQLVVADLTAARLRAGFAGYADGHAKASVRRAWATWNRLCDHLVVEGLLAGNPMAAVPKPKAARSAPQAFTDADMTALLEVLVDGRVPARYPWPIRDYALIATLAATGLRRSEVLALTVDDVEGGPGARQVAVRHGKGDKYRAVPVDPRLEDLLAAYLAERWARWPVAGRARPVDPWSAPARAALWLGDKGQPLTSAQLAHLVERAYRAAGINSHRPTGALVHALRHTFATSLLENGATAIEVMGLLGHASLATTQRYLTTRPDHLRGAVAANPVLAHVHTR